MLVNTTMHIFVISNTKAYQSKTKYNKIAFNISVCINMITKQSARKIEV